MGTLRRTIVAGGLLVSLMFSGMAQASTLSDYFEVVAGVVPNKLGFSLSQEAAYRDNVNSSAHKKSGFEFKTGLTANWTRSFKNVNYGVNGEVKYTYDTADTDDDQDGLEWSINPTLNVMGGKTFHLTSYDNIMVWLSSRSTTGKIDNSDTTYSRQTDYSARLVYDLVGFSHVGLAVPLEYSYTQYAKSEYKYYNHHTYSAALAPYYKVNDRIKLGLEAKYTETKYTSHRRQDDSSTISIGPYVNYAVTEKINVNASVVMSRKEYKGKSRHTHDSGDFKPIYSVNVSYTPNSRLYFNYHSSLENEDSYSANRGGRMSWSNSLGASWDITERLTWSNSVGMDLKDEKNGNWSDNTQYSYESKLTLEVMTRCSVYAGYEMKNVRYKYAGKRDYTENTWRLGMSYNF